MKESNLRRWHRNLGILLALFIILQAGSGFLISLSGLSMPHSHANDGNHTPSLTHEEEEGVWHEGLEFLHHGAGRAGAIYRILLGIGLVLMAVSGSMIFFKIRARTRKD